MTITTDTAPARHALRFEGSAGEYFKIWIVNLALTIVTLGFFSAWAKVRNRRYFLGNTYLGQHSFDYHGSPLRILLGRVIALALLLSYSLTINFAPKFALIWVVLFFFAFPWLVRSSLRFNARNTSYRNIRFDFHGSYWGAFKAFVLWTVLAGITLWTTFPLAHRARDYYNINNHSFGGKSFEAKIPGGKLYLIYGLALLFLIVAIAAIVALLSGSGLMAMFAAAKTQGSHPAPPDPRAIMRVFLPLFAVYFTSFFFIYTFIGTLTFNLAVSSTVLADRFALQARLSPFVMTWIALSNLLVTLLTLDLMYPWALVRQKRYVAEHIALTGPDDFDGFVSAAASQSGAIGEEVAGFFDIDIGL